jgi:hypothetical protein
MRHVVVVVVVDAAVVNVDNNISNVRNGGSYYTIIINHSPHSLTTTEVPLPRLRPTGDGRRAM